MQERLKGFILSGLRPYILWSGFLFIVALMLGYAIPDTYPDLAQQVLSDVAKALAPAMQLGPVSTFLVIFFNNSVNILLYTISGVLFAIPPLLFIIGNGAIIGLALALGYPDIGLQGLAAGIVPHGIFEIPALLLSVALGTWLGVATWQAMRERRPIGALLNMYFDVYAYVIIPLLVVAAAIEATVTPELLVRVVPGLDI